LKKVINLISLILTNLGVSSNILKLFPSYGIDFY